MFIVFQNILSMTWSFFVQIEMSTLKRLPCHDIWRMMPGVVPGPPCLNSEEVTHGAAHWLRKWVQFNKIVIKMSHNPLRHGPFTFSLLRWSFAIWAIEILTKLKWMRSRLDIIMDKSTDDSLDASLCDANLEELKEQWTLKQLELSKQVSEVLIGLWPCPMK